MDNKEIILENFTKHFKKFIYALKSLNMIPFINNNYEAIILGIDINEQKIMHIFMNEILQYEQQINARDENFFLNFDFNKKYNNLNNEINKVNNNDIKVDQILQFKNIWLKLTQNNKDVIINYMILLCKLSKAYKKEWDKFEQF